ncbi:C2 family cysteine protease [Acrocarpospora corrugata]|uniref:C2 family cysteine protease n=1 Tax=Acrocarpospora corrugata TaxID=35763 RepID=UPI001C3F7B89|nr:C2 family cysteine protease [Acrocarpospora corrugata]
MDGKFINEAEFHPDGDKTPRRIPAGTSFTFADGVPNVKNGTVRIRIGNTTGTVNAADVVADEDVAKVAGLVAAGSTAEIQNVTSLAAFAGQYETATLALTHVTDDYAGKEHLIQGIQAHRDQLKTCLWSVGATYRVAEAAVLYFASESSSGHWPTLLRLWAERPKAARKIAFAELPAPIKSVFTDLVQTYVDGFVPDAEDRDPDHTELSFNYRYAIESFTLIVGSGLNAGTKAVCKPIVLGTPNIFATVKGLMAQLPELQIPRHLVVHSSDIMLDQPVDVPDEKLPTVVMVTARNRLWLANGPSADDVCQGELGDCFFLALLAAIACHDPAQIKRLVKWADGKYVVTFTRTISHRNRDFRVPQPVELTEIFPHNDQNVLLGARPRVRCGDPVVRRRRTLGGDAYLERAFELETALWVPVVERAFAALVGRFGQYANTVPAGDAQPDDGYAKIRDGSQSGEMIFSCLYGHRYRRNRSVRVSYLCEAIAKPPRELDPPSAELLNLLLMVHDQAAGLSPCLALPTASVGWRAVGTKLLGLGKQHTGPLSPHFTLIGQLLQPILDRQEDTFATLDLHQEFQDACTQITKTLLPLRPKDPWAGKVVKLVTSLAPPLTTQRPRPYVYARHEYAVGAVHLVFSEPLPAPDYLTDPALGRPPVNSAALVKALTTLDTHMSTIALINPHHKNSPNLDGTLPAEADTGSFVLPLAEFLEFFTYVGYAVVSRHA